MAGIWCLPGNRRQDRGGYLPHPFVVYLYLFSHLGVAYYRLHDPRFLDEYQELHPPAQEEPREVVVKLSTKKSINFITLFDHMIKSF